MDTIARFDLLRTVAVIVLGAVGTWLLFPHAHGGLKPRRAGLLGAGLAGVAGLILLTLLIGPGSTFPSAFFYGFAAVALSAAVLTITARDPVYSALWFAAVVLSTSGLFLLAGAQFLAAGTIIVYAGAIIVTFLFVIMLAQKEGLATYDRAARSPARATFTCSLLLWSLLYTVLMLKSPLGYRTGDMVQPRVRLAPGSDFLAARSLPADSPIAPIVRASLTETNRLPEADGLPASGRHVAGLGGTLFTDHLVTVELVGSLLFAALIGALAIATPKPPIRPGQADAVAESNPPTPGQ